MGLVLSGSNKRAQALGFTLEDVAGLLQLNDTEACAKNRALAARKLALIEKKISELVTMRDALAKARRSPEVR